MLYSIGQWVWAEEDGLLSWGPPDPAMAVASIDLRSLTDQAKAGSPVDGFALFVHSSDTDNPDLLRLGDQLDGALDSSTISAVETRLDLGSITSDTVLDLVWDLLTVHSDPTGGSFAKPLMPGTNRLLELSLAGHSIVKKRRLRGVADPHWPKTLAVLQGQYRDIQEGVRDGRRVPDLHRKMLSVWMKKYSVSDHRVFIPHGLPDETPIPPTTIINESFNSGDSDTLGPDLTWTEVQGDIDISSNAASVRTTAARSSARAESDLSSDDQYASTPIKTASQSGSSVNWGGPACRFDADATDQSSTSLYTYQIKLTAPATVDGRILKAVSGTLTNLVTNTQTHSSGDVWRVQADGSTIKGILRGIEKESVTDTAVTGHLRGGLISYVTASGAAGDIEFDSYSAADLLIATPLINGQPLTTKVGGLLVG